MASPRYAIYYTPPPFSPLARFGAGVLGYDCFDGVDVPCEAVTGIEASVLKLMTVEPRRYGFHATIVAPFHLNHRAEGDLLAAADDFAARTRPVPVGPLVMTLINSFVVLVPAEDRPAISLLAAESLRTFHPFCAPLTASDRERRLRAGLSAAQVALMDRWGYPYVLDQFQFHMTLAGPVPEDQRPGIRDRLWQAYQEKASSVLEIDAISVLRQDEPGERFRVLRRCRLRR
jgi:hypothetical protein